VAFVRSKKVDGYTYYQLVKNERVDGKHRQRVLMHLGRHRSVEAAIEEWTKHARISRQLAAYTGRPDLGNTYADKLEEKASRLRSLCGD
jgi:hypothetical protein